MRLGPWTKSALLFLLLALVPLAILIKAYEQDGGFLSLIHFGQQFADSQLPSLRAIAPPMATQYGYDGQFYAQIGLDPLLRSGNLEQTLDNPTYRARRIGLPGLAALLGGGRAEATLYIYALINFAFWILLAVLLLRFRPPERWRDVAMIAALLLTSGTLVSLSRALTDLPAAALSIAALLLRDGGPAMAWLFGLSALFKETSVLSFGAALTGKVGHLKPIRHHAFRKIAVLTLPLLAWLVYVHLALPSAPSIGQDNFAPPLAGLAEKILAAIHALDRVAADAPPTSRFYYLFELLAPLSLVVQAVYLCLKPRLRDPMWAFGAGFVVLLVFLGNSVWVEQFAYCRVLLPLTFAFNLLLHAKETGSRFWWWFAAGNLGLTGILGKVIYQAC